MMKKILAALLCAALLFALAACSGGSGNGDTTDTGSDTKGGDNKKNIKIGVILIGDENEGYTYAHIEGIKKAMKENNISEDQVVWKYNIPENEQCKETAEDLAEQGCTAIFSNSYNHQTYMQQVAGEPGYEDITFVSATGDTAANSGLKNFKNCFTKVYESRYVSGIVAGMKLAELVKDGKIAISRSGTSALILTQRSFPDTLHSTSESSPLLRMLLWKYSTLSRGLISPLRVRLQRLSWQTAA